MGDGLNVVVHGNDVLVFREIVGNEVALVGDAEFADHDFFIEGFRDTAFVGMFFVLVGDENVDAGFLYSADLESMEGLLGNDIGSMIGGNGNHVLDHTYNK